jgi:hypothetical protein
MAPLHISTYLTLSTYLAIAFVGLQHRLLEKKVLTEDKQSTADLHIPGRANKMSDDIFWHTPAEFCWPGSFAGTTFASKTAPAKFKMRQQNF